MAKNHFYVIYDTEKQEIWKSPHRRITYHQPSLAKFAFISQWRKRRLIKAPAGSELNLKAFSDQRRFVIVRVNFDFTPAFEIVNVESELIR